MESTVRLGLKPAPKSKQGVKMDVESRCRKSSPKGRVGDKRGIQSQELGSQRESNQEWLVMAAANKNNQVKTKEFLKPHRVQIERHSWGPRRVLMDDASWLQLPFIPLGGSF